MIETIRKKVTIPDNHMLNINLDIPKNIPPGEAELVLVIATHEKEEDNDTLFQMAGCLSKSKNFSRDPLTIQKELRDEWR